MVLPKYFSVLFKMHKNLHKPKLSSELVLSKIVQYTGFIFLPAEEFGMIYESHCSQQLLPWSYVP